jgi:hypothetical protein
MSHQSMIKKVLRNNMHVLFIAKPDDHKYMFEWIDAYPELPFVKFQDKKGELHHNSWQNVVALHSEVKVINGFILNEVDYEVTAIKINITELYT